MACQRFRGRHRACRDGHLRLAIEALEGQPARMRRPIGRITQADGLPQRMGFQRTSVQQGHQRQPVLGILLGQAGGLLRVQALTQDVDDLLQRPRQLREALEQVVAQLLERLRCLTALEAMIGDVLAGPIGQIRQLMPQPEHLAQTRFDIRQQLGHACQQAADGRLTAQRRIQLGERLLEVCPASAASD